MVKGLLENAEITAQSNQQREPPSFPELGNLSLRAPSGSGEHVPGLFQKVQDKKGVCLFTSRNLMCLISAKKWQIWKKKKSVSVIYKDCASCLFLTWVEIRWGWLFLFYFFHKYFISLYWLITETCVKIEARRVSRISYGFLQLFWIALLLKLYTIAKIWY